jgi:hypothetical protein
MTVAELTSKIGSISGVAPRRGVTTDEILAAEARIGKTIPLELRQLVQVMNGCDGETPPDRSWITFWPLRRWRTVADLGSTPYYAQAVIFADHCQESWWYAFESTVSETVRIVKINGPDCVVSESLAEFLEAVLFDDPKIYGNVR